ncbi:TetR/AcrR family transcriptional regulator [Nocardioides mangrovi]|uniref:TetR/AcrR family transcriptional regulator n=1 Tax=Nocardioides mangrovi TaxID=2874580 RepID=A0ABS7UJC9_9ACTN|nr:TetR/AcrR family transcriptional regulator [Nocardioides mangrovi]MBZ5740992.1 TetR/AcrR family transcriptional regulator [Nocardioides mangrovi]
MPRTTTTTRASEPRDRLLRTASGIFYAKGIHAVGVDEIVTAAGVTRATFYRHFPSKDDLVVAYLHAASAAERAQVASVLTDDLSPEDGVRAVARAVAAQINDPAYRGCAFLNAAAEYPDTDHPVHRAVLEHRQWFLDTVTSLAGREKTELFVLLRDGAMASGCLADPRHVGQVFLQGVEELLGS